MGCQPENGEMELPNWDGDLFAKIGRVDNMYPVKFNVIPPRAALAAWTMEGGEEETTHELVGRLGKVAMVAMVAMVKGADVMKATLVTWYRWLGHPSIKTVAELVITVQRACKLLTCERRSPALTYVRRVLQQRRRTSRTGKDENV